MLVKAYGKVVSRSKRERNGVETFYIVIEEPGVYPSYFQFSSRAADKFGPADGFAAVGKMVTATGFCNGRREEVTRKDGTGTFDAYRYWFTLSKIEPAETQNVVNVEASIAETKQPESPRTSVVAGSPEAIAEDIPF